MWGGPKYPLKRYSLVQHALLTVESLIALPTSLLNPILSFLPTLSMAQSRREQKISKDRGFWSFTAPNVFPNLALATRTRLLVTQHQHAVIFGLYIYACFNSYLVI